MSHDSTGNSCPSSGYIMAAVAGSDSTFSTCSIEYTNQWLKTNSPAPVCLMNVPKVWLNADSEIATNVDQKQNKTVPTTTTTTNATTGPTVVAKQKKQDTTAATTPVATATISSSDIPTYVPWLVGFGCFFAGVFVTCATMALMKKLRESGGGKFLSTSDDYVKSSPVPPVHQTPFTLNIAPSAPSTPISSTKLDDTTTGPATVHHTQHVTRAKRRPSVGATMNLSTMLPARIPDTIPSESPDQ